MTNFLDLCPKADIELTPILDKAMETALHVLEEVRSSISDRDYYIFMLALCNFLEPHSAPTWEGSSFRVAMRPMQCAVLIDEPQEALDKLRAALWAVENLSDEDDLVASLPEYRDGDIAHLRKILTYWQSSEMSIAWNETASSNGDSVRSRRRGKIKK
jgi:hypothetical protein